MISLAVCCYETEKHYNLLQELKSRFQLNNCLINITTHASFDEQSLKKANSTNYDIIINLDKSKYSFSSFSDTLDHFSKTIFIIVGELTKTTYLANGYPYFCISTYSIDLIWNCISNAYYYLQNNKDTFIYYKKHQFRSIKASNIIYLYSQGRQIHIVSNSDIHNDFFYGKLNDFETALSNNNNSFVRIHKSYLVNASYISCFNSSKVQLNTGEFLKISTTYHYHSLSYLLNSKL